jgi:DNA-binding transcriptional LysR family regulator
MNPDSHTIYRRIIGKAKFRHLNLLIHLHELRNMKRAAEALGLTQPSVSLTVSELEKLIGAQLFVRHARGVDPTSVATELVPVARRILAAIGDGSEIISNSLNEAAGYIRVASTPAAVSAILHPVASVLARKFPQVHIEITEIAAANPFEPISDETCDILCLRQPEVIPENWAFEEVMEDALVVVAGSQHRLACSAIADAETLRESQWLLTRRGSVARNRFEDFAEEIGLPNKNRCGVITHVPMLTLELLAGGDYLTLVPRSVAMPWLASGLAIEIESPATTRLGPLGFLWQREVASRVTRLVANELRNLRQNGIVKGTLLEPGQGAD